MKKFFIILFLNLVFFNYSYADQPWGDAYNKKMKVSKEEIVAHKKWAKNYHKGIHMAASLLLNLTSKKRHFTLKDFIVENFDPEINEGAREKETNILIFSQIPQAEKYKFDKMSNLKNRKVLLNCCKYSTYKKWSNIFDCILFTKIYQKELYIKHTHNWLYYASFSPIWKERIDKFKGKIESTLNKVEFENEDYFEEYHEKYEYEIDEQPVVVQNKIFGPSILKKLNINDLFKKYEPCIKIHKIKKIKRNK